MKVVFDGRYYDEVLTKNKIYDAIILPPIVVRWSNAYEIVCDDGVVRIFDPESFISLKELREEKLKRILQ
jgi:hypothetical protein